MNQVPILNCCFFFIEWVNRIGINISSRLRKRATVRALRRTTHSPRSKTLWAKISPISSTIVTMGSIIRCSGKRKVSYHRDKRKSKRSKKLSTKRWWEQTQTVVVFTVVQTPGSPTMTKRRIIRRTWPHRSQAERWAGITRRPCFRLTQTRSTRFQSAQTPSPLSRTQIPVAAVWTSKTSWSTLATICSIKISYKIKGRLWHLHSLTWTVGASSIAIRLLLRACALETYSWVEPKIRTSKRYKRWS